MDKPDPSDTTDPNRPPKGTGVLPNHSLSGKKYLFAPWTFACFSLNMCSEKKRRITE
jgi:hypothetical protein